MVPDLKVLVETTNKNHIDTERTILMKNLKIQVDTDEK